MESIAASILVGLTTASRALFSWSLTLVLLVGLSGCQASRDTVSPTVQPSPVSAETAITATSAPADGSSVLPERLAAAIPSTPQDPELMVETLHKVFEKWAQAGYLQDSPDVLAGFYSLLVLSNLDPAEIMHAWLSDAQTQANDQATANLAALETELPADLQPLTLEESFFYLWRHANEEPDSSVDKAATTAGVRLALIAATGDENLQREIVRAWRQFIEGTD